MNYKQRKEEIINSFFRKFPSLYGSSYIDFLSTALDQIAKEVVEVSEVEEKDHVKAGNNIIHDYDEFWGCCECYEDRNHNDAITTSHQQLTEYFNGSDITL